MDQIQKHKRDQTQVTETIRSPLPAIVIVTLIVVAAMAILVSSSGIALRIANKSTPLINASMEI